jgi:integrase
MASIEPIPFQWRKRNDASRYKAALPGSRWKVRYRDANGRSRSRTFDRKIDAERFLERNGADIQRGEWVDPRAASRSFDDLADAWWESTVQLAPHTRRCYWLLLQSHVLPFFGGMQQGSIDWLKVEEFINDKIGAGYNPKRVRDMVSIVSLIMKLAIRGGVRKDNPAADHGIKRRKRKLGSGQVLTMEQAHSLVRCTRDPYKPLVWLLVLEGLRPGELCGLTVRDIEFQRRRMHVHQTLNYVHGYDGGTATLERGSTKTDAGDRMLPLPADLCDDLAAMLAGRAERLGRPIELDEPLFESVQGDKPLRTPALRRHIILPALRAAGLPESLRTYDLRHTHASLLIDQGANVLEVAQRMGHTDPTVTLRVYGHLFDGAQDRLTATLDDLRKRTAQGAQDRIVVSLAERREGAV